MIDMVTRDDPPEKLSEIYRRIDELKARASKDPDHVEQVLSTALEALESNREELSQQNEELLAAAKENRRLLTAVQEERDKLSALVNSISDEVWFADTQKRFTLTNPSALREFSISSDGEIDVEKLATSLEVYRPDGSPRPVEEAPPLRAIQGEVIKDLEEMIRTPATGELRYRQVSAAPVRDANGNIIGSVSVVRDITDYKRMEKELAHLASFPQLNPNPIVEVDPEGCVHYLNNAAQKLFPDLQEKGLNHPWLADWKQLSRIFRKSKPQGCARDILVGGTWYQQLIYSIPEPKRIRIYGRDITNRKKMEEALLESEQRYATTLASIGDAVIATDIEGKITFMNKIAEELTGWTLHEAVMKPANEVFNIINENTRQKVDNPITKVLANGMVVGLANHTILIRKDGTEVAIDDSGAPIKDRNDNTTGVVLVFRDITERRHVEEALQESEQLYRAIGESIDYGVWVCAPDGRNIYASESFLKLVGITQEQCSNFGWGDTLHPDDTERTIAAWKECVRTGGTWDIEHRFRGVDGKWHDILARGMPVRNERGEVTSWAGINLDISRIKLVEGELRKARDELEMRVLERTADLSEAKEELECMNEELRVEIEKRNRAAESLRAAKDAAEAAVQTKSDFMANMSHEIRTPMNAVIGMTSILLDDADLNPEQKDFIETIKMNGDALMVIINDILDFSKMESEKAMLEEQPFELRSNVEEALDLVSATAADKKLNLAYTIDNNVPECIIGDPTRLRQILGNLLHNAVKFTERGEINLSVLAPGLSGNGTSEIHFAVQDTGIGISPDQMDRLFQPFSQVDATVTRKYGGTGLGLAISKKLVEQMGGNIWVESKPGICSTFHFTIKADAAIGGQKTLAGVQPQLAGKSVLIADDNKTNRHILGAYVYSWGMSPLIAASGKEALGWIQRGDTFDVAILDMSMPEMDGLTLAKKIRKYNKSIPLVMLTSMGQRVDPDFFDAYLFKPIKPSQLHKVLINIFVIQQSRESVRAASGNKVDETKNLKILLAEDNVSSQKVALQILKRLGYKADVVANGIEVLQALERQPYDLVLMDIRMPEMDGLQATRIIRQRWPDNGPKIIAITAYALQGDKEKCIEAGMDDYISKPIKMNELAEVLSKYQTTEIP